MLYNQKSTQLSLLAFIFVLFAQLACNLPSSDDQSGTVEALAESISGTATAGASGDLGSGDSLETVEARATAEVRSAEETKTAAASLGDDALSATATAIAPILRELPKYDIDPDQGRVAWIYPPTTLEVEEYMSTDFENRYLFTTVSDFVISADITWNTQYGTSGCGFILRSDGKEEEGNNYMVVLSRVAEGHVIFMTVANGEMAGMKDMYVPLKDPTFTWDNDTTNRLTVVGQENIFRIYSNAHLIGEVKTGEPPSPPVLPTPPPKPPGPLVGEALDRYNRLMEQYDDEVDQAEAAYRAQLSVYQQYNTDFREGFVTLGVMNESGHTVCHFDNTWLFLIEGQ
jgi:hypothetical protein